MLTRFWLPVFFATLATLSSPLAGGKELLGEELVLAEKGQSDYRIVVADGASPSTKHAAEELQQFLAQICGAKLPIVSDSEPLGAKEIILGENAHLTQLDLKLDLPTLGNDGYAIETSGQRLVIAGGALRGNLYGVYGLLEDHLGCRWFTPTVSRIPKQERLAISPIHDRQKPVLEYREPFIFDCFDGDWAARNRMNSSYARLDTKHGGKITFAKGSLAHTFSFFVPPSEFFATHPEYFSLVGGKRQSGYSQLCCTNEDVIRLCTEKAIEWLKQEPQAMVVSVSQNDCFRYCECEKCQALAKAEGSQMAPVLQLVNRVAEEVEKVFPDKAVQTLAYQWTRQPPKNLRPRKNVIITLCSIECCFMHPIATCDGEQNKLFRADIEGWSKTGARIWVWDYVTNFGGYMMPFPNQRVLVPNIRYFVEHGVKGIFEEGAYESSHGDMAELAGYLMAKCLWNPNYDAKKAYTEFLEGYYGVAAEPMGKYLGFVHDYVEKNNIHLGENVGINAPHLTDEFLLKGNELMQAAEDSVQSDAAVIQRVQFSRLSIDWAVLERVRYLQAAKQPVNPELKKLAAARFEPFMAALKAGNVTRTCEGGVLNLDAYRQGLAEVVK